MGSGRCHTKAAAERKFFVYMWANLSVFHDEMMLPAICLAPAGDISWLYWWCLSKQMHCLLNMQDTLCGDLGDVLWNACSALSARDQWRFSFSGVCVASDTFIQTKEAPVAVLSVAANSRGMSRCRTKDEMFSLRNHNPPKAIVGTCHANVASHMYCTVFDTVQGFIAKCCRRSTVKNVLPEILQSILQLILIGTDNSLREKVWGYHRSVHNQDKPFDYFHYRLICRFFSWLIVQSINVTVKNAQKSPPGQRSSQFSSWNWGLSGMFSWKMA